MKTISIIFITIFLSTSSLHSLTFKKDGTVISSDGEVLTKSMKERYTEALANFRAGLEVEDFPIAKSQEGGGLLGIFSGSSAPKGFFGSDIVDKGAPLFPLPRDIDLNDPIASIAKNLGMNNDQFVAALVSSASDDWLEENNIAPEAVPTFDRKVDDFIEAERQLSELSAEGIVAINATGLTPEDIRSGAFDSLLSDTDSLIEAAPILLGAPVEVQMAFESRAMSIFAAEGGIELPSLEMVEIDFEALDAEAIAEGAQIETERLLSEGYNAVNGTELTVQDVLDGRLDETIGVDTAIVNASEEVYAAYEQRVNQKLAIENGIDVREIEFVNRAVREAGVTSAAEAGAVAARAATEFQNTSGAAEMAEARLASEKADQLADIAKQLEEVAAKEGTEEAKLAAQEAAMAAEEAAAAAQVAGEAAMVAAGGAVSRSASEAAWEAASQNAYENAISAAMAAGASAEEAAAQAAEAAASAGQAAFEAAALAAGQSAEEAAANAAAEAAEQSALRDLERRLESGEITEAEFNEALNDGSIPDGAPN